ncbi:MAG: PAS domain-containing sensor histidine kinase [Nanoarchaeota archaeon]|nr:PAS domain-containing sensor histidine kinase [Nanoarchaeota archaeon]
MISKKIGNSKEELIEQLRKTQVELRNSEKLSNLDKKRLQDVVNNVLGWIWEVDVRGRYTYVGPFVKKYLGYKPEDLVGKKCFYDLFHPEDREELKRETFAAFKKKQNFHEFINRNVHKSGKVVWFSTSGIPIFDKKGKFFGYRGVDTDITEKKESEQLLETDKNNFISMMIHELKAPLMNVVGLLDLLLYNKLSKESHKFSHEEKNSIKTIILEAYKIKNRVDKLIFTTKLEKKKELFFIKKLKISEYLKTLEPKLRILPVENNIRLKINNKIRNMSFYADPMKLEQVFANVIENSVRYSKPKTTITISVKKNKQNIIFEVKDQGVGIANNNIPNVFKKFPLKQNLLIARKREGLGLGLYICKIMIERMHGAIKIKSKRGKGTMVQFTLPRKKRGGVNVFSYRSIEIPPTYD